MAATPLRTLCNVQRSFGPADSMMELVNADYNILPTLSRFALPLGFGNRTIAEHTAACGIDTDIFLLIVNFILTGRIEYRQSTTASALGTVDFLHNSHEYFLSYKFPHIRAGLTAAMDAGHSDINPAIMRFFDDFTEQVRKHFHYEETTLFPYIRSLAHEEPSDYNIEVFRRNHEEIGQALSDLKNIILRYYSTSMPNRMYDALVDIFNCEADLELHNQIENFILVPMISAIEHECRKDSRR